MAAASSPTDGGSSTMRCRVSACAGVGCVARTSPANRGSAVGPPMPPARLPRREPAWSASSPPTGSMRERGSCSSPSSDSCGGDGGGPSSSLPSCSASTSPPCGEAAVNTLLRRKPPPRPEPGSRREYGTMEADEARRRCRGCCCSSSPRVRLAANRDGPAPAEVIPSVDAPAAPLPPAWLLPLLALAAAPRASRFWRPPPSRIDPSMGAVRVAVVGISSGVADCGCGSAVTLVVAPADPSGASRARAGAVGWGAETTAKAEGGSGANRGTASPESVGPASRAGCCWLSARISRGALPRLAPTTSLEPKPPVTRTGDGGRALLGETDRGPGDEAAAEASAGGCDSPLTLL